MGSYSLVDDDGDLLPSVDEYLYEPPVGEDVASLLQLMSCSPDAENLLTSAFRLLDLEEDYLQFKEDIFPDEK